jgi:hypothetical protein
VNEISAVGNSALSRRSTDTSARNSASQVSTATLFSLTPELYASATIRLESTQSRTYRQLSGVADDDSRSRNPELRSIEIDVVEL